MKTNQNLTLKGVGKAFAASCLLILISACHDDDDEGLMPEPEPMQYRYQVDVTNLTNAQPMSPFAVVLHNEGMLWNIGESANDAMENLAESGDNSQVLDLGVVLAGSSGADILMPGNTETIDVMVTDTAPMYLSAATMLVNTNDAFTGINALDISQLTANESISMVMGSYDAGTEKNSELAETIPGPAAGGEGYNAERDDVDFVSAHPGVVTMDDGLTQSVLTQAHRFDNPTIRVTVTRIE
ncbi:spondin domain-containing protein [Thalassotalea litorea]|uniref:spondin domain-containing protein n=1 Tax=Thalassotalea litorea TaxID=2020715 RepID=UPI003735CA22